jgi:hypothetical protein
MKRDHVTQRHWEIYTSSRVELTGGASEAEESIMQRTAYLRY